MVHALFGVQSALDINVYHFEKEVLALVRESAMHLELSLLDLPENFSLAVSVEWHLTGQQLIEANSEGPDVTVLSVDSSEDLWGNVVRCSCDIHISLFLVLDNGESEIDELDLVLSIHDILWLDVSMDDVLTVAVTERSKQFDHYISGLLLTIWRASLKHLLEQLSASAQLHAQINVFLVIVGLVVLNDIGMVNLLHELHLALQTLEVILGHLLLIDNFDCYFDSWVLLVLGQEHFSV